MSRADLEDGAQVSPSNEAEKRGVLRLKVFMYTNFP